MQIVSVDEEEDEIEALNLGIIAAYYYIQYTTIELLASSLTAKTKLKGLLEIVSSASEFDDLPMRPGEQRVAADRRFSADVQTTCGRLKGAMLSIKRSS